MLKKMNFHFIFEKICCKFNLQCIKRKCVAMHKHCYESMPHYYYNQCFLDKMKAEAENAEKASVECGRLAAILQNGHSVRKMLAAANTATAAAVNVVCIARLYETDTAKRVNAAQSVGSEDAIDFAASKAMVKSALAAAKKAEAIALECIKNTGAPVKCDAVWLETSPPLPPLPTFAICLIAFCTLMSLQWQLFAVCAVAAVCSAAVRQCGVSAVCSNTHAKKAADLMHAADKRSASLDDALLGVDHKQLKEAYAAFFTEWRDDFETAVAENQRLAAAVRLTIFSMV